MEVKIHMKKKIQYLMLISCMFFRKNKSSCVLCSLSSAFYFIGDKIAADRVKYNIKPSLKSNNRFKFAQDVKTNCGRERGKSLLKLKDGYDIFIEISPFPTLIQLKYFISGIHYYVKVSCKCIFGSNFNFSLPLTQDKLDYSCI